jgi:hypothetical protein
MMLTDLNCPIDGNGLPRMLMAPPQVTQTANVPSGVVVDGHV